MRRIIYRLLFGVLVVGLLLRLGVWERIEGMMAQNYHTDENTRSTITYLLPTQKWLSFVVPSFSQQLKCLTMANLPASFESVEPVSNLRYSIVYELLDDSGKTLVAKIHYARATYFRYQDSNGSFIQKSFYLGSPLKTTTSQSFVIDLKDYPHAKMIRFRLLQKDSRIVDVVLRNYYLEAIDREHQRTKWKRMSQRKRTYLSRGNLYPTTLMQPTEKYQLVSTSWRPNGPVGLEGEAYQSRRLFVLHGSDSIHPYTPIEPNIYSDATLWATRYLGEGNYTITFTPLSASPTFVTLFDHHGMMVRSVVVTSLHQHAKQTRLIHREAGLLEVRSSHPIKIDISDGRGYALPLPPLHTASFYDINASESVGYRFLTPYRRDLKLEVMSSEVNATMLHLTLKDTNATKMVTLHEKLELLPSHYDYRRPFEVMSETVSLFLPLSRRVGSLEMNSSEGVSLRLLVREGRIPYPLYDWTTYALPQTPRLPAWFALRPEGFDRDRRKSQEVKLRRQAKPPTINPIIASGIYDIVTLYPTRQWRGVELLLKRSLGAYAMRTQAWGSTYMACVANRTTRVWFGGRSGERRVQPTLHYRNLTPLPQRITVVLDNRTLHDEVVITPSGSLLLPPIEVGRAYEMRVGLEGQGSYYLSHARGEGRYYTKRTFIDFEENLTLSFEKRTAEESLGVQLALPEAYTLTTPLKVEVRLSRVGEEREVLYRTFSVERYQLHTLQMPYLGLNLTRPNQTMRLSKSLFIPLGENLPLGVYQVTLHPQDPPPRLGVYLNHVMLQEEAHSRMSIGVE